MRKLSPAAYAAFQYVREGRLWDGALERELSELGVAVPEDFVTEMLRIGALTTAAGEDQA